VADIHATLVFGKRFILLKAPYPTQLAGRQVKESLIDRFTELTIGSVHIEVVPRHEIGKRSKRPRVIRSQELAEHASLLSSGEPSPKRDSYIQETEEVNYDLNVILRNAATLDNAISRTEADDFNLTNEQKILAEERLVAIETTLGKLQSAVEVIQSQSQEPVQPAPVDLSQQLAAMGKSVAEDLEQRLANRLDSQAASQAASQATLVSQIRDEALRPIESTLEGLLVKLDDLSSQQLQTSDKLEALSASTDFRLAEWNQWRESLLHPAEQDYGTQHQSPQATALSAFEHLDSELQSPLTPIYNSDYLSQDNARQDFLTDDKEFPSFPEHGLGNTTPKYPDVPSYGQIRLDGSTGFAGQYSVEDNSFENEIEQGSELPSSEPISWREPSSKILSDWVATREENLFEPPSHPEITEDVASSFKEQPLSDSHTSDGQDSYSTEYETNYEIPVLTTLENQAAAYDANSNLVDDADRSEYHSESGRSSEFGRVEKVASEEAGYDYQDESPLAAYLKSSSSELPDQKPDETPNNYSANLDSYLAVPELRDESAYAPSFFQQTPYSIPDESYAAVDESTASEVLREPADELSERLRQMLAEIKAEDEQSDNIAESDLYPHREIASETEDPLDEKEQASRPSWLRDYAPSYPNQDEDRPKEIFNDFDPYSDRSQTSMASLDSDSTTSLDAQPEMPSFDWNKGSLLSSEAIADDSSQITDATEEQDENDDDQSPFNLASPDDTSVENDGDEREESIEEYMQKLLKRVKQGTDEAGIPLEELTVKSAPRSRREFLNRTTKSVEPDLPPLEPLNSQEPIPEPVRRPSPAQVDMNALRELANSNARRAIARSETKRANTNILIKVAITSFAIAAAALILLLNGFNLKPPFAGFVAALVVAFLWGTDCYKHFKEIKSSKAEKPVTIDPPVAEEITVRTGDEAESGWRPSPI
jgi:hypothetical protein